jgi:NitT/TauT family transport system substrate-binding protein
MLKRLLFTISLILALTIPNAANSTQAFAKDNIKVGLLPIYDTIILHVAKREGFFKAHGLDIELIPFQSAMEKDAAVLAGALDGHFCEIGSVILQRAQGLNFKVVATTSYTDKNRRNFGLVTKPNSEAKTMADLQGKKVAVSRLYIVDFLTDVFLSVNSYPEDYLVKEDIKKIPLRFQMLLSGQVDCALLPEPLVTLAQKAGALVLLDDTNLDMPLAVVALKDSLSAEVFCSFQSALSEAVAYINQNPESALDFMLELGLVMGELAEFYQAPTFDPQKIPYTLPSEKVFDAYLSWLIKSSALAPKGQSVEGLRSAPRFEDVVLQALQCSPK